MYQCRPIRRSTRSDPDCSGACRWGATRRGSVTKSSKSASSTSVASIDPLPNGNVIFGNSHAGPDNPQLIEVTRDKKVVWTFKNWDAFGNTLVAAKVVR